MTLLEDQASNNSEELNRETRPRFNDTTSNKPAGVDSRLKTDREKTCPMLIRMFCREGGYHSTELFNKKASLPDDDELILYTWKDATLKELSTLIKEVHPESRSVEVKFLFRIYHHQQQQQQQHHHHQYSNSHSRGKQSPTMREVGIVSNAPRQSQNYQSDIDEMKNLEQLQFVQGDYIDVAIVRNHHGDVSMRRYGPDSRKLPIDKSGQDQWSRPLTRSASHEDRSNPSHNRSDGNGRDSSNQSLFENQRVKNTIQSEVSNSDSRNTNVGDKHTTVSRSRR